MARFSAQDYKERLAASESWRTCEKVPLPKLFDKSHYIFISYSHKDYKQVYADLADLYENNIPFWYDSGLDAGANWDDVVPEKLNDPFCIGVIFYMSERLFLSRSIQKEIDIVCTPEDESSCKKYFCVNLSDELPSQILKSVFLEKDFPGAADDMGARIEWLQKVNAAFPDKATYLSQRDPKHTENLLHQIGINFGMRPLADIYDFRLAHFRSGHGTIEFNDGSVYEGDFLDGKFHGQGTLTDPDGDYYTGQWDNGKRHGQGTEKNSFTTYIGEWVNDKRHGQGTLTFPYGTRYTGSWERGRYCGYGTLVSPYGPTITGYWENGWDGRGHGTICERYGDKYEGEWLKFEPHGKGIMHCEDGSVYDGEWSEGEFHGQGTFTDEEGNTYTGEWSESEFHGQGTFTDKEGNTYTGEWENGEMHGIGTMTCTDGTIFAGHWKNGEFIGGVDD